ncbi:nucleoside-diphosphate-sugar epimerase [Rhodococcus sp. OK519]|uniref:NAD-dependent epimerase/dehydratase family protein n=1 Tax=Rhodococcus sp. OK519 TaxID=2135729 RepID=UPI000D34FACD|nr:nucleoside-diphosphate-sugar epimerase [Rhodococcus sp. OK519]
MTPHDETDETRPRVALFGAAGFIGDATLRALVQSRGEVTALVRRPPDFPRENVRYVLADIGDPSTLLPALEGIDVIVHAAGYTGSDENLCKQINYDGTRNVLTAAAARSVDSVINLSTIGVYGQGPFRDIVEDAREPNPVTTLSATRAAADRMVRADGGITVRPGFIHGLGDRWFLPGLRHILARTGAWIDDGTAMLSTIAVDELGELIAHLALTCSDDDSGALFHAASPQPLSVSDIATRLAADGSGLPHSSCSYAEALARADSVGLTARHIDLVGRDHTIDSTKLWHRTGRRTVVGTSPEFPIRPRETNRSANLNP